MTATNEKGADDVHERSDLTRVEALSFDCYGTLIDWETGILAVLRPWATEAGIDADDESLLAAFAESEAAAERELPTLRYPNILAEAFRRVGTRLGAEVNDEWASRLGGSVGDWPAFDDSPAALATLAAHYTLIIVSNVHREGFAASNRRLHGRFAAVITAEDVGAYKPADPHFDALDRTIAELGIEPTSRCTSPRACSTTTAPRVAAECGRCGSTGAAVASAVGRRRPLRTSTATRRNTRRWPSSPPPCRRHSTAPPDRRSPTRVGQPVVRP